jgi:endonuclease/exonuclease/phosphatase family metal-dependent hydrolase
VRALTFNAGLATNFVAYAPERLDKIGPAVAGSQADVVCLQEVWSDADAAKVGADLLATYPYQHRVVTTDPGAGGPAACSAAEADPLAVCVNANCVGAPSLAECALGNCFAEYSAAGDGCKTCLAANIGQNSIAVIFDACAKGSSSLAFDGRNGLLLLSKTPLSDTGHIVLDSYLNTRIALHATTTPASGEPLSVVCTHLTAVLPGVSYSGKYADWAAEQAAQIGVLRTTAASIRGERNQVILGDFNTGPELTGGIAAEVAANYTLLVGSGDDAWRSVMVEAKTPACSWCADNPLNTEGTTNLIDHTLLAGPWKKRSALSARVLDEPVTLQVSGQAVTSRLSDHYGILTEVTKPAPACE